MDLTEIERQQRELDEQIKAMLAKQNELREAAEAEKRKVELSKPVAVTFTGFKSGLVMVKNEPYREDILQVMQSIPGRYWNSWTKENAIPLDQYSALKEKLTALNAVTVEHAKGVEQAIHDTLFAPDFRIEKKERSFHVRPGRNVNTHGLRDIPGTDWNYEKGFYTVPLSEGHRLWVYFDQRKEENLVIEWDEAAFNFITEQVKQRAALDAIALATDADVVVPGLKAEMRPFQRVGVKFFQLNGGRGILADEMGLGKTLQLIALALVEGKRVCAVVPATLKINWAREIKKFTDEVPYICSGATPTNYDIAYIIGNKPKFVIINYDIIRRKNEYDEETIDEGGIKHVKHHKRWPWVEVLNLCQFDRIYLDEAHMIKNVDSAQSQACRQLQAGSVICATGTPVLNRPGELWPMLNLIDPMMFPSYETFIRQYTWDGKRARNVEELREVLKPLMIRRLKKDVVSELPMCNRIYEYHEASEKAQRLYDKVLAGVYEKLGTGEATNVQNVLVQIMRCKQVLAYDKVEATADLATRIYDSTGEGERPKKVLIFSQFKAVAYSIAQRLGGEALSFVSYNRDSREFVTADNDERQRLVDEFQNNPNVHFLVVTEKTAKEGHNITAAMAVIFNDLFWTPAAHQQGEGRAYGRLSDLHPIDAYYHVGTIAGEDSSIDELIVALLANKLELIEQVVEGVNASRSSDESIVDELIAQMKERMWRK